MAADGKASGRAEEIMEVLLDLELRTLKKSGAVLPPKPAWARALFELPLNFAGLLLAKAMGALPAGVVDGFHRKVYAALAGAEPCPLSPRWEASLKEARALHDEAARRSGGRPALLAVLSHPPVGSEVSAVNFALMGRGFEAAAAVRGLPARTRLVGAIDPFALDAAPFIQEGLYAGALLGYHLAIDRQPKLRGPVQRLLLAPARPEHMAWRLESLLVARGEAAMMMAGGVEPNARLLYTARELFKRWRRGGGPPSSRRRALEREALAALTRGEPSCADTGRLSGEAREALAGLAAALGVTGGLLAADLADFEEEFARAMPYRRRLFSTLLGRVLRGGTPVLLLPLTHGRGGRTEISLGEPCALMGGGPETFEVLRAAGSGFQESGESAPGFARNWVRANFD